MRYSFFLLFVTVCTGQEALTSRERYLLDRVEKLEQRLAALEARAGISATLTPAIPPVAAEPVPVPLTSAGTSINVVLDSYYAYNFRQPLTRSNILRAYDVSSNSFAINQAGLMIEQTPNVLAGRHLGGRLDLMFGQATETLQGSFANEPRPEVFRHIYQAYGTYVAPIGKGLRVDFGKWASSFGMEGNYTKDQFNYSRSYWFNFLPYYHMGFRTSYAVTEKVDASYWLTNGLNQSEDFNQFKSQSVLFKYQPTTRASMNLNYYNGQEQRAMYGRTPKGRTHLFNSYFTWRAGERWTLAGEGNYALDRVTPESSPRIVYGGAGYAQFRALPRLHLAGRFTYLNDRNGMYTGINQALKDTTATATFDLVDGFQMRWEYRRDWSNVAFFPTSNPEQKSKEQDTALLGLTWWFGGKQGPW